MWRGILALTGIASFALVAIPVHAMAPAEKAKVEHLLTYIGGLRGCTFVRNGKEYDAVAAEKHLRMKCEKAGDRLGDARDFIERVASRSTVSGEEYKIRSADGTVRPCRDILLEELARYEKAKGGH